MTKITNKKPQGIVFLKTNCPPRFRRRRLFARRAPSYPFSVIYTPANTINVPMIRLAPMVSFKTRAAIK
jgi:hypothetical protein